MKITYKLISARQQTDYDKDLIRIVFILTQDFATYVHEYGSYSIGSVLDFVYWPSHILIKGRSEEDETDRKSITKKNIL